MIIVLENGQIISGTFLLGLPDGAREATPEEIASYEAEKSKNQTPQTISPRQARLALLGAGLLDEVDTMLATNKAWQIEWEYATKIERSSPLISAMATQLNLTDTQIDEMFASAAQL